MTDKSKDALAEKETKSSPTVADQKPLPANLVRVKAVDARAPYPLLNSLWLVSIPRPGDILKLDANGRFVSYNVQFVNFDPFDNAAQITLGCIPVEGHAQAPAENEISQKQRVDDFVKSQLQIFEKAEAYSKGLILAGFAGTLAIWGYVKDYLSPHASELSAILIGISLFIYVTFEIVSMVFRVSQHYQFNSIVHNTPLEFLKH